MTDKNIGDETGTPICTTVEFIALLQANKYSLYITHDFKWRLMSPCGKDIGDVPHYIVGKGVNKLIEIGLDSSRGKQ